jgi:formylglycine-generating enzyme required for sulfatase activity
VGRFRPNAFSLPDMIGKVREWRADCWRRSDEGAPAGGRAWTAGCHADANVLRGRACSVDADKLRVFCRYHFAPRRMPCFGFRVARRLDEAQSVHC